MRNPNTVDMVTAAGNYVWYDEPSLTVVDPEDIRIQTTNICRYNGALDWKLVKHLALVAFLVEYWSKQEGFELPEQEAALQAGYGASHDFHEIYCTDVVHGLKQYIPAYNKIESAWEEYVTEAVGLPWSRRNYPIVRKADVRALVCEMTYLGHPWAQEAHKKYGGAPTATEQQIFAIVQSLSLQECWEITWRAVVNARNILLFEDFIDEEEKEDGNNNGNPRTRHADQSMY